MRASEAVAFVYFAWLVLGSWVRRLPWATRWQVTLGGGLMCAAIAAAGRLPPFYRDWAPGLYLLIGYFLCGRLFSNPSARIEAWLLDWDRRLFGDPTTRFSHWPYWLLSYLDVAYLCTFLLPPSGLAVLVWAGHPELADRYWTIVLAAEFVSFGALAVFQTRPPWALEARRGGCDRGVPRVALEFVRRGTIGANTFPSGHAAGSLAVAFAVIGTAPVAGALFLAVALSISLACVVGRYHYTVDVAAGVAVAVAVWLVAAAT